MRRFKNLFKYHIYISIIEFFLLLFPSIKLTNRIRVFFYKPLFKECGKNLQIAKNVMINMYRNISIGDNVYIAHNCWINGAGDLIIEDDVVISPNVIIATTKHKYINRKISNTESESKKIIIGEGSWIAGNSTIILGVEIGIGNIIAAGSVVTKNTENFSLYAGTPAKFIKELK